MEETAQDIVNRIYQQFYEQAQAAGITFSGYDPETGTFYIPTPDGATAQVRLDNLLDYYFQTHDENAVSDFVIKIKEAVGPKDDPTWEEAKENIYVSPCNYEGLLDNPYAKERTGYFSTVYVIDTPNASIRILPQLVEEWGVTEEDLEKAAMENGARLLEKVSIEIGDVEGHLLGSFMVEDRNLTGACLFAPGMKEKVGKDFGWPIYVVFPDKITCYFFGKDTFDYFESRIGNLVAEKYDGTRRISPELMEFNDNGIKPLCSWTMQMGHIVRFDESEEA